MPTLSLAAEGGIEYRLGNRLIKQAGDAVPVYDLSGKLTLSSSGWLLLSVPNSLLHGAFDALDEAGLEKPYHEDGSLNAHISVMSADEVESLGGGNKISERGHSFRYTLGPLKTVSPRTWDGVSKVWYITVYSPELRELRKSYGLTAQPHGDWDFHITIAVRKTGVLGSNPKSKAADDQIPGGLADNKPDSDFPQKAIAQGVGVELEHTTDETLAKEIAKDHLTEDVEYYDKLKEVEKSSREVKVAGFDITIDRPKGFVKSFRTLQGPVTQKYPLDYGYFKNMINPQDDEEADVFVGSGGNRHGRYMKGTTLTGEWQPDEYKWYTGLTDDEYSAMMDWWGGHDDRLIRDEQVFDSEQQLADDLRKLLIMREEEPQE